MSFKTEADARRTYRQSELSRQPDSIQIAGLDHFEGSRWREAILAFLFGVWGNKEGVMYRPKIDFAHFGFRLDPDIQKYSFYNHKTGGDELVRGIDPDSVWGTTLEQYEFEAGLVRFVKNDRIRMLWILEGFALLKGQTRGELHCIRRVRLIPS